MTDQAPVAPLSARWTDMDDRARREYWAGLALRHCRGLGARSCCRLLRHFGSAFAALEGRERWADAGVDKGKAAELSTGSWRVTARAEWDAVRDLDAVVVQWHEAAYPALLRTLPDAPVLLYCLGDLSLLANPAVAVIGSRKATPRGQALAGHMAGAFSSWGITVVSGMAWGIDKAAHEAALGRAGSSIAVLGTGIDVPYPRANTRLYDRMAAKGLLVSEFAPAHRPCGKISLSATASSAVFLWAWSWWRPPAVPGPSSPRAWRWSRGGKSMPYRERPCPVRASAARSLSGRGPNRFSRRKMCWKTLPAHCVTLACRPTI